MKRNITDLYFGVMLPKMSYSTRDERRELEKRNLFDSARVLTSIATYVKMTPEERKERVRDPLRWCFMDVDGRAEWEFIISPWPYRDGDKVEDEGTKVSVYQMYVEPNRDYLMELVDSVSVSSATKYLSEYRRRYRR